MALLGTLFNVAKVGVGLLNSVINPSALEEDYVFEYEGKEYKILGTFIANHSDRRLIGSSGSGFTVAEEDNAVTFTLTQAPSGGYSVWANNTDPNTPYNISYTSTNSGANSQWVPITIPAAQSPPDLPSVDVTAQFDQFSGGNVVSTPITPSTTIPPTNKKLGQHSKARIISEANTLLGNLGISTVTSSATWQVYRSASGTVTFSWSTALDGSINGYNVTNTLPYAVDCSVNITWNSPATLTTVDSTIPAQTTTPQNVPLPEANDRPIDFVNVAVSSPDTSAEFVNRVVQETLALQAAEGIAVKNLRLKAKSKVSRVSTAVESTPSTPAATTPSTPSTPSSPGESTQSTWGFKIV